MRILLAGGAGVIGSRLLPALLAAGHEVVATTRREERIAALEDKGARGVLVDVFDADRVAAAISHAEPDLIMHQLTDLSANDRAANARLRRDGTANLLAGAKAAGVERIIAQSVTWIFPPGGAPATEDDAPAPGNPVETLESLVTEVPRRTVLRYGMLYGPGTWYATDGRIAQAIRAGQFPATSAITQFVHVEDVTAATVQALDWPDGTYHIADDDPAPATEWLPVLAAGLGAPTPPEMPRPENVPLGRAVSTAKAKAAGWAPIYPTWRPVFANPDA
ncbi:MAG: dTDP-glucose 4,6-dehydratase [Pseudonocardia sp. SCN 72-86]|nr:MAG: dTDP-glucose 4,6-dehydratase [Pseudonocardia sp. SCN 72-86]